MAEIISDLALHRCTAGFKGALHNSLRMGVVQVGMSCKAHFAVQ